MNMLLNAEVEMMEIVESFKNNLTNNNARNAMDKIVKELSEKEYAFEVSEFDDMLVMYWADFNNNAFMVSFMSNGDVTLRQTDYVLNTDVTCDRFVANYNGGLIKAVDKIFNL